MSVFSFLNNVLSGQKSTSRIIDGFEVSYSYFGKPVLFDPITMLQDLKYKIESKQTIPGELCGNLGEIVDSSLILKDQLNPSVVARLKIDGKDLRVVRFVKTFETVPCSRYDFFLNQIPLCSFQRMYDYGKNFASSREKLIPFVGHQKLENETYWKNDRNEALFLEHFGHTQLWMIHSVSDIQNVWRELVN